MKTELITNIDRDAKGTTVSLAGDIDLSRSPDLKKQLLAEVKNKPGRLIVDLENVGYMDSSGVATLVEALQRLRKSGGKMVLCNLQPRVLSIFQISRLDTVFTIVDGLDEPDAEEGGGAPLHHDVGLGRDALLAGGRAVRCKSRSIGGYGTAVDRRRFRGRFEDPALH